MAHLHPFPDVGGESAIPMFGKNGTALTQEERAAFAKRRGLCVRCGKKTHGGNILRKTPLNNDDVYQGICIKCNPDSVPTAVYAAWEKKNKPQVSQQGPRPHPHPHPHGHPHHPNPGINRFRATGRAVQYAASASRSHPSGGRSGPHGHSPPAPHGNVLNAEVSTVNPPLSRKGSHRSDQPNYNRTQSSPQESHGHNNYRPYSSAPVPAPRDSGLSPAPPSSHTLNSSLNSSRVQHHVEAPEDYKSNPDESAWDIVKAIKDNKDNPDVLRQKLHGLRNLGDDEGAGAMYEVKELMELYKNSSRFMAVATGAVWGMTSNNVDKKNEAAEAGVLDTIVDSIRIGAAKDDADAVQWSLGALVGLANETENKQLIPEKGGIEAIVDILKSFQDSPGVFEWSSRALHSLVHQPMDSPDCSNDIERNIISIDEANGLPVIISAMKKHTTEPVAQIWAMKLLWRLLDRTDEPATERTLKKMNDNDCVAVCVKVLKARSTSPELFMLACELICSLLSVTSAPASSFANASECVTTCVRVMTDHSLNDNMQLCCIGLLGTLARGGSQCKRQIADANGFLAIANGMNSFPTNIPLMVSGFNCLWLLSSETSSFDFGILGTIKRTIDACLDVALDNEDLSCAICGFLANIALAPQLSSAAEIPLDTIIRIASDTSEGPASEQAGRALAHVCCKFSSTADRLIEDGTFEKIIDNLHSSSPALREASCSALTAIALRSEENREQLFSAGCLSAVAEAFPSVSSESLARGFLDLTSALVVSTRKKALQLPNSIIQSLLAGAVRPYPSLHGPACTTVRNAMLVTVPGFSSVDLDGAIEWLCGLVDSNNVDMIIEASMALWALTARQPKQTLNHLSTMFRTLLSAMGRFKGDGTPYHAGVQAAASGALAAVLQTTRDNPIHIPDNDIDMIISVLDLVIECDLDNTELMEQILDCIMSLSFLAKEVLIQFGVIVVVIDAMVEHEHNEMIQEKGCAILALLASTENLQVNLSIAETDGIDMIVSALAVFSENSNIQVDACRALSHLSIDHESRMLISSQGGLILLVNAMNNRKEDEDLLEAACSALLNLSSDAEEQVLAGSNVVETVVNIMRYQPDSARLQEKGLGVLQNVSMRSRDAKRAIADAGGINAVTFAIKEFMGSPAVLERAFTTLWSLAVHEENQILVADANGISLVVNGMMANISYEKVQKQACGCLCTLSSNSRNKTLIRDVGGVDSIVYAMWAHYSSDALQIEACRALSSLAVNVQTNEVMIATDGEINAIMSAMRRFPTSERLQEHACVALRNFLLSADNAQLVRHSADEVVRLMNHASAHFPDRCAERAKQVLASLA